MTNSCMSVSLLLVCICFVNGDSLSATQTQALSISTNKTTNTTTGLTGVSTSATNASTDTDNSTNVATVSEINSAFSVSISTTNNTSSYTDNWTMPESYSSTSMPTTDDLTPGGLPSVTPSTGPDGRKEGLSEEGQLSIIVACVIVGTSVIIVGVAYLSCYFNKQKTLTYEQRNTVTSHMNGAAPKLSSIENGDIEMKNIPGGDALSVSKHNPSPHPSV